MKSFSKFAFAAAATLLVSPGAMAQSRAQYESMVASHAAANNVPEALVHRVIVRESKYHPGLVGRGGTIGLMQIKLPTARGLGYTGDAAGLRDPDTNLAWGIKYRQERPIVATPVIAGPMLASDAPPKILAKPVKAARTPADANALQTPK
jgi:soluble lytic murein transglycosylase-like protein